MNIPSLLLLASLSCYVQAQAQMTFERIYSGGGTSDVLQLSTSTYLCGLHGSLDGPGMAHLNVIGEVIGTANYVRYPILSPGSFKLLSENNITFTSGYVSGACDGSPLYFPVIGRMDSVGHISSYIHYEWNDACKSLPRGLEITQDRGVVTWGWQYDFFALRVDSNLNPFWAKHFNHHGHFQFIKELPGGDLLAGFDMDTVGGAIARLNADGDFLWCKSYMRPAGTVKDCVIESDSSFVIIGMTDNTNQNLFMMNLDGEGEVQWCRGYGSGYPWRGSIPALITRTNDGAYALLATNGVNPVLMKTDLNGNTLWTRTYGAQGYGYETWGLLASTEGGYLISGMVMGDLPEMNTGLHIILKTDSVGILPCTAIVPRSFTITELFPLDSSFVLTPINEIPVAFQGSVVDTAYAPFATYDGCIITSAPSGIRPQSPQPRIRPNPNTGQFTVQFTDPLAADSFYSVYDAVGKLLFQRPLPTGTESEEIDLSRFGAGTYLVRITSKDGVCNERVVVQ